MTDYEMNYLNPNVYMRETMSLDSIETENTDFIVFNVICRRCNEDDSKGKLISPCKCTGDKEFIHIHCLESISNLRKHSYCTYCGAAFPLKIKYKPLIEICRNRREIYNVFRTVLRAFVIAFNMLVHDLLMFILIGFMFKPLLIGNIDKDKDDYEPLINVLIFGGGIVMATLYLIHFQYQFIVLRYLFKTVRGVCSRWYARNTERKVIKNFIQEI